MRAEPNKLTFEYLSRYAAAKQRKFSTSVAGITFRDPIDISQVDDGDAGYFEAELDNENDKFAVAIMHDKTGAHVGYVKREINRDIFENITKNGDLYVCRFTRTGNDEANGKPNLGLNLKVVRLYFDGDSDNV